MTAALTIGGFVLPGLVAALMYVLERQRRTSLALRKLTTQLAIAREALARAREQQQTSPRTASETKPKE